VTAATAAREAGFAGSDQRAYAEAEPGQDPLFNVFDFLFRKTTQSVPLYQQQAFRRGQTRARQGASPGMTLILAFGPSATCLDRGPLEQAYGLLAAFVDGLLAGRGARQRGRRFGRLPIPFVPSLPGCLCAPGPVRIFPWIPGYDRWLE
jgi:hypothetical protein